MFDNPKKELERLEQQLLAAESYDEEEDYEDPDDLYDDTEDFDENESFDPELDALLNGGSHVFDTTERDISRRAAGFDADYEMDTDRYVPAPRKKNTGLIIFALVQALAIIGFVLWALRRML